MNKSIEKQRDSEGLIPIYDVPHNSLVSFNGTLLVCKKDGGNILVSYTNGEKVNISHCVEVEFIKRI